MFDEDRNSGRGCGRNPIAEPSESFEESSLSSEELSLLIDVYSSYGKYTSGELLAMTHKPGGPWDSVYVEGKNNLITLESMRDYFANSDELHAFTPNPTAWNTITYFQKRICLIIDMDVFQQQISLCSKL